MIKSVLAVALLAATVSACATKNFPIATPLGMTEASMMTCHDIELELVRVGEVRLQIQDKSKRDWRSPVGYLDLGIGNAMARSEAETAIDKRALSLMDARMNKKCDAQPSAGLAGPSGL